MARPQCINAALAPLDDFIGVMSGDNFVTGSAILPIVDLLCFSVIQNKTEDKPLTNELHNAIIADLLIRNTSPEVVHFCMYVPLSSIQNQVY